MNDEAALKDTCLDGNDKNVISVVEERAVVDTVKTTSGSVQVNFRTYHEKVDVPVETTDVKYQESRIAKNIVVDELPGIRQEGDLTIIPVTREEAVVTTQIVLVEEIHIRRRKETQRYSVPVTLLKDEVTLKRE